MFGWDRARAPPRWADRAHDGLRCAAQGLKCDAVRAVVRFDNGKRLDLVFKSKLPRERRWVVAHETSSFMSEGRRGVQVVTGRSARPR